MHLIGLLAHDMAEDRISELEYISVETFKAEKQREQRLKKTEQNSQGLWDTYERCNIGIIRIPE